MSDMSEQKKEILKDLVRSDQDYISRLRDQVEKSKKIFWIEESTGKIIPTRNRNFTSQEKILIQLIGKSFAKDLELTDTNAVPIENLRESCGVSSRALSVPIGILLRNHIIEKTDKGYVIKLYLIEECINDLISEKESLKMVKVQKKPLKRKKQMITLSKRKKEKTLKTLNKEGIKSLSDKVGVEEKTLHHIFDFDEHEIRIIKGIEGSNEGKKQLKATLLYLTVYKYCFDLKEISSSELRERIEDLGIKSLVNLSTNLRKYSELIVHKRGLRGPGGSTDTSYKITIPGEFEGIKLISEICKTLGGDKR